MLYMGAGMVQCWERSPPTNMAKVRFRGHAICGLSLFLVLALLRGFLLLSWNSLQHRRHYLSLVECYKTVFGLSGLDLNDYFECCRNKSTRANHPFKIQTKSARINAFNYSFFDRIIKEWNNLPNHLFGHDINDINANRFKSSLKKWMNIH